jgi:hypothetical protein
MSIIEGILLCPSDKYANICPFYSIPLSETHEIQEKHNAHTKYINTREQKIIEYS